MMEEWQYQEDQMLANPPESDSHFKCQACGEALYEGEPYYELDGEIKCYECACQWLDDQRQYVTYEQEKGI